VGIVLSVYFWIEMFAAKLYQMLSKGVGGISPPTFAEECKYERNIYTHTYP